MQRGVVLCCACEELIYNNLARPAGLVWSGDGWAGWLAGRLVGLSSDSRWAVASRLCRLSDATC